MRSFTELRVTAEDLPGVWGKLSQRYSAAQCPDHEALTPFPGCPHHKPSPLQPELPETHHRAHTHTNTIPCYNWPVTAQSQVTTLTKKQEFTEWLAPEDPPVQLHTCNHQDQGSATAWKAHKKEYWLNTDLNKWDTPNIKEPFKGCTNKQELWAFWGQKHRDTWLILPSQPILFSPAAARITAAKSLLSSSFFRRVLRLPL